MYTIIRCHTHTTHTYTHTHTHTHTPASEHGSGIVVGRVDKRHVVTRGVSFKQRRHVPTNKNTGKVSVLVAHEHEIDCFWQLTAFTPLRPQEHILCCISRGRKRIRVASGIIIMTCVKLAIKSTVMCSYCDGNIRTRSDILTEREGRTKSLLIWLRFQQRVSLQDTLVVGRSVLFAERQPGEERE